MSTQHTPGPWEVFRFGRQGSIYVARELNNGRGDIEVMLTADGRRRTFRTEASAQAAIAKVTGGQA